MKAVWSQWTSPLFGVAGSYWLNIGDYLCSFVLSLEAARPHFSETVLVTDEAGANILIGDIGLNFDTVILDLEDLDPAHAAYWNLGKIYTLSSQHEPFIHIDNDLYLWEPLPQRLISGPIFAQNPEHFTDDSAWYTVREIEEALERKSVISLPREWKWCRAVYGSFLKSINTGIFGGHRTDFIKYTFDLGLKLAEACGTDGQLAKLPNQGRVSSTLELFVPAACLDYHGGRPGSPFADVRIEYLFASSEEACHNPQRIRYTHILGAAKKLPDIAARLEHRVGTQYPELYLRCRRFASRFGELFGQT